MTKEEFKQILKDVTIERNKPIEPYTMWVSANFAEDFDKAMKQHYDKYIADLNEDEEE